MHHRLLLTLAATALTGAAPPQDAVATAAECRSPYPAALVAARMLVERAAPENADTATPDWPPRVLGQRVLTLTGTVDERDKSVVLTTRFDGPYLAIRTIALQSRFKDACIGAADTMSCRIEERREGRWNVSWLVEEQPDGITRLTCVYAKRARR
jgi:hypothetical protein